MNITKDVFNLGLYAINLLVVAENSALN